MGGGFSFHSCHHGPFLLLPVNRHVILSMVCNIDKNSISFLYVYCRPWKLPVYSDNWLCMTQSTYILHLNLRNKISEDSKLNKTDRSRFKILVYILVYICYIYSY